MSATAAQVARILRKAELEREASKPTATKLGQIRKPKPRTVKASKLSPEELAERGLTPVVRSREELLAQSTADSYLGLSKLHPNLGWENDRGTSRQANTRRHRVTQVTTGYVRLDRTTPRRGEIAQSRRLLGYK